MPEGGARPELAELAARIAGWAAAGEQVEAFVSRSSDTDVRVHEGDVEQLSSAVSEGAAVRVVAGDRQGFAWAGSLDPAVLAETLAEARDNAGFASPDPSAGLASPDGVAPPELDWDAGLETHPTAAKIDLALDLERRTRGGDRRVRALRHSDYHDSLSSWALATSTGLTASSRRTVAVASVVAIAGEGAETQTGFGATVARGPGGLDLDRAAGDAVRRSTRMLGAVQPRSRRVTVVLEPNVAASLVSVLAGTLNGDSVLKGRSLFAGRLGERVAAPGVTLVDDATDAAAFSAATHDAEGLASRPTALVRDGVLQAFLHDTRSARRAGAGSTASAVRGGYKSPPGCGHRAVSLAPGRRGQADILAAVGEGLLVQSVSGLHSGVNPVSGDFSVGAEGLLVERGEPGQPVREITISSTLQRMLLGVVEVGDDLEWMFGPAGHVTLAVADVAMSGS